MDRIDIDDILDDLKDVNWTDEDMEKVEESELDEDLIALEIEDDVLWTPEPRSLSSAKKETRETVKELLATFNAIERAHKNTKKYFQKPVKLTLKGETLCLMFCDWHFGKIITKEGLTVFNSEIAYERITKEIIPQVVEGIRKTGKASNIEDVTILFLGDLIENDIIYETQRLNVDKPVTAQFNDCLKAIMAMLASIEGAFASIEKKNIPINVYGITGNHGRASGKKEDGRCSWDTALMAAMDVAVKYSDIRNVNVQYSYKSSMVVDIRGHRGLIRHSAPVQTETSAARSKLGGWSELFNYDFLCSGHFHSWFIGNYHNKPIFRNGSLCGTDDFAENLALGCDWTQLMFGVSADEVPTFIYRIN